MTQGPQGPNDPKADAELSTWRGEWQGLGGSEDFAAQLVARARKDGRKLRLSAAAEVLAALFSTTVCLWLLARSHGSPEVIAMTALILPFNGAWLTHFFTARAGTFDALGASVGDFITLTRQRLATQRKWMAQARRWTIAIGIAIVPWALWVLYAHRDAYAREPWRGVVGFGTIAVILAGVLAWTFVKERKLGAEAEAFERHLADTLIPARA